MTDAIALFTLLIISSVVATAGVALICDFRGSAATLADRVDRFLSRWPAWFRDDRGSYERTAIRWWGLTLLAAGALPIMSVLAGLADKGRAGQAHALLLLPLAALGAVMFAIGRLSARYRRKQTTVQAPLTSVLVSFVSFAVVLLCCCGPPSSPLRSSTRVGSEIAWCLTTTGFCSDYRRQCA